MVPHFNVRMLMESMFGIISKSPPLRRHPNLDGDTEGKAEQAAQTKAEAENGQNSATRQEEDVDTVQAERPLEEPRQATMSESMLSSCKSPAMPLFSGA